MAGQGRSVHETIDTAGRAASAVSAALDRALATLSPYKVFHDEHARFHLVRTYRPVWAVVVGVCLLPVLGLGLLFFLIKRTESCAVTVTDGPTGAVVTVAGRITAPELERLRSLLSGTQEQAAVDAGPNAIVVSESEMPPLAAEPIAPAPDPSPAALSSDPVEDTSATALRLRSAPQLQVRFDDGRTVSVDGVVIVGRDPATLSGDDAGSAIHIRVPVPCMSVSKTHLAMRSIDGRLWVEDLHSTNGTSVRAATGERAPVPPGQLVPLAHGSVVHFGERTLEVVAE